MNRDGMVLDSFSTRIKTRIVQHSSLGFEIRLIVTSFDIFSLSSAVSNCDKKVFAARHSNPCKKKKGARLSICCLANNHSNRSHSS